MDTPDPVMMLCGCDESPRPRPLSEHHRACERCGQELRMPCRCGYCGSPGQPGRCVVCGSAMTDEAAAVAGAGTPHYLYRWLASRDRGWQVADEMRAELHHRRVEDLREGRDPSHFDGLPAPDER